MHYSLRALAAIPFVIPLEIISSAEAYGSTSYTSFIYRITYRKIEDQITYLDSLFSTDVDQSVDGETIVVFCRANNSDLK